MPRRLSADPTTVLSHHGLPVGPEGHAMPDLVAFAEARGWRVGAEEIARPTAWARFRAVVWQSADPRLGPYSGRASVGRGPTAEAALSLALASALARAPEERFQA